jgi:hypothetical protein
MTSAIQFASPSMPLLHITASLQLHLYQYIGTWLEKLTSFDIFGDVSIHLLQQLNI